jgi:hypothetical protein
VPTAKKELFTLGTARCRTTASTKAKLDAKAIAPGRVESRVVTASCQQTTGPGKSFGAADMALGKKKKANDACTRKVKSRYSVWPSAYASGALVKCRKVGAANWGNKSK